MNFHIQSNFDLAFCDFKFPVELANWPFELASSGSHTLILTLKNPIKQTSLITISINIL